MKLSLLIEPDFYRTPNCDNGVMFCGKQYLATVEPIEGKHGFFKIEKPVLSDSLEDIGHETHVWFKGEPFLIQADDLDTACKKVEWLYHKVLERFQFKIV